VSDKGYRSRGNVLSKCTIRPLFDSKNALLIANNFGFRSQRDITDDRADVDGSVD
jgi:hypothetical protein